MTNKEFGRGQIIFKQGDLDICMYDIQKETLQCPGRSGRMI